MRVCAVFVCDAAREFLQEETLPLEVTGNRSVRSVGDDAHPRPETTIEILEALKPIVRPGGTTTAVNSSGIDDGAAAMILASEKAVQRHGLVPRARVLGAASRGVAPRLMGIGPVPASLSLCERLGLRTTDFGVVEINEAFAAQVIASLRELGLGPADEHVNRNGGAIALGHPLGMSGARLVQTAVHQLEQIGQGRTLVTMRVEVGQGLSLALEAVT